MGDVKTTRSCKYKPCSRAFTPERGGEFCKNKCYKRWWEAEKRREQKERRSKEARAGMCTVLGRTTGKPRDGFGMKTNDRDEPETDRKDYGKWTKVPGRVEGAWTREEALQYHKNLGDKFPSLGRDREHPWRAPSSHGFSTISEESSTGLFKREKDFCDAVKPSIPPVKKAESLEKVGVKANRLDELAREIEEAIKTTRRVQTQQGCRKQIDVSAATGRAVIEASDLPIGERVWAGLAWRPRGRAESSSGDERH